MKLEDYKIVLIASGLIGALILASPTLGLIVHLPSGDKFSELWILNSSHMAENYPFNVTADVDYLVYVGVGNHLGSLSYYIVYVKFGNETEPLPDSKAGTPSALLPLYEHHMFLADNSSGELALTFSFSNVSFSGNRSTVGSVTINGVKSIVGESVSWDMPSRGYYYQLFIELWIYNSISGGFDYHNRFASLWLNMTVSV
jgi:hypothetical protein